MDFDNAVNKLNREQSALRNAARHKRDKTQKQNLQAARMRKLAQERLARLEKARILKEKAQRIITDSERELRLIKSFKPQASDEEISTEESGLKLKPVSVWGDGDKITLPTSVLESLLAKYQNDLSGVTPMTFRVGLLKNYPEYQFPACEALKNISNGKESSQADDNDSDVDDIEEQCALARRRMYLEELSHKYHSYTYATPVEFTQEEGHVGIPIAIARSLCAGNNNVSTRRTVDPASSAVSKMDVDQYEGNNNQAMDADMEGEPKTPGHIAYGAFNVPDLDVELSMVVLPKGKGCTLVPSIDALQRGFHGLKDVKATLEQSLVRTRATLSVGDEVYVWHRGVQFDLKVSHVIPGNFGAVSCINTDIEVDFGNNPSTEDPSTPAPLDTINQSSSLSNRNSLSEKAATSATCKNISNERNDDSDTSSINVEELRSLLPNEPPTSQTDGVCTVLIRSSDGKSEKRRFDVSNATIRDLFHFALTIANKDASFQLVTRFPRKVFARPVGEEMGSSLVDAGITSGQEMFLIEWV